MLVAIAIFIAVATGTAHADTVTDWNQTAIEIMKVAGSGQPLVTHLGDDACCDVRCDQFSTRPLHALCGDNSFRAERLSRSRGRGGPQQILLQLLSQSKSYYQRGICDINQGHSRRSRKESGVTLGEEIAAAVQADRCGRWDEVADTYRPITSPGVWVPTTLPLFAQYAQAKPWVLNSADQFRPGPPPALTSEQYARDYNETKTIGGVKSNARTPEQTEAVKFWTQANLGPSWQAAARELSAAKKLSLAESARLFALLNMGIANTFINDWDAKFTYNFWRPITAIRNGDTDGNAATEREAGWTPLNATPMHPEYPSQAAIICGLAVRILEPVFGPNPAVRIVATDRCEPYPQAGVHQYCGSWPRSTKTCVSGEASIFGILLRWALIWGAK